MPKLVSILQKIITDKQAWIVQQQATLPLSSFIHQLTKSDRDFYEVLQQRAKTHSAFILECKKASPSKGVIREQFDVVQIAKTYQPYAAAISVLTDEPYFQGKFSYLTQVREQVSQPILCKDFMISEYQIYLARYYQADAVLLMLSVLDDCLYQQLATLAHKLGMGVLTEVSTAEQLTRAIALKAKVIGINNRDLHDLSVDIFRTLPLAKRIPPDRIIISESGITDYAKRKILSPYVHGFLIGSGLMAASDLNNAIRAILFGEYKICGLTRPQDVRSAYSEGALYGGLIFAEKSPRCLSLRQAQELVVQAPLRFVGVFQNQPINYVRDLASQLNLFAIQLHGDETVEYIAALRKQLPSSCQIWKAVCIQEIDDIEKSLETTTLVDRYIFDNRHGNQYGGTGQTFDWSVIPSKLKFKIMLAGGISPENIQFAIQQHCLGIDINSGVESRVGVKDPDKLASLFNIIQTIIIQSTTI